MQKTYIYHKEQVRTFSKKSLKFLKY